MSRAIKPMPDRANRNAADFSTDAAWEEWGRHEPYFGVITDPKFRRSQINEQSRREFFESGSNHVEYILGTVRGLIVPDFSPARILDFGCGVGRTLIPFAGIAQQAVGADVSVSMLEEARRNCDAAGVTNVSLIVSDDSMSSATEKFDLVHSFIVFQHIPLERGRRILANLLDRIRPGGVAAIHILYSKIQYADNFGSPPRVPVAAPLPSASVPRRQAPPPPAPVNPEMQMNPYPLTEIFFLIQSKGVQKLHAEFTDHGGELGVFLFLQMP